jgi:hypothetical protein
MFYVLANTNPFPSEILPFHFVFMEGRVKHKIEFGPTEVCCSSIINLIVIQRGVSDVHDTDSKNCIITKAYE